MIAWDARRACFEIITSGARSAERVLWFKGEISVCAARPDPTRPHHAFEKLISLERVD